MAFYSISSYSPFKINSNVLTPGVLPPRPVPPFSLDNSFRFTNSQGASSSTPKEYLEGSNVYSELDGESSFAVSLWVKLDLVSRQQSLFMIPSSLTNSGSPQFQIMMQSNQIIARYKSGQYLVKSNIDLLNWNTWTHILVTRDNTRPSGSRAKIFINGVDETLTDGTGSWSPSFADSVGGITIGRNPIANNQQFAGNMTEVSIYKQDMASFVSEIYDGGVPNNLNSLPTAPQPTTWFRMGENAEWNGTLWNLQDVINAVSLDSSLMVEANRVTDLPPTPTPVPPGQTWFSQKSFRLDGIDERLTLNNPLTSYTGELTFSIWFNQASEYGIQMFGNIGGGLAFCFLDINANNKIRMRFGSSSTITFTSSTETIERYEWNHLLLTRNSSNSVSLFVNGVSFASSQTLNGAFDISSFGSWGSQMWSGILDEIALWTTDQSANVSTIFNGGFPGDISTLNPNSWYRADGDTPPTVLDNGSDGEDITMTNFSTFSNDVPTVFFSNTKSLSFDGIDDRVELTPVSVSGEFSVSFWMKPATFNDRGMVGSDGTNRLSLHIQTNSTIRIFLEGGTNRVFYNFGSNLMTLNQWQHMIICRDSNNVTRCYRNGVLFNDGGATTVVTGTFHLKYIGARSTASHFQGGLDEVAYWDSDQSANASAIGGATTPTDLTPYSPLGWWRFEGTGTTATDSGSGGNNGTLINGVTRSTDIPT